MFGLHKSCYMIAVAIVHSYCAKISKLAKVTNVQKCTAAIIGILKIAALVNALVKC